MFIDIVPVTNVTVEFSTEKSVTFPDQFTVNLFIAVGRAHNEIFDEYPDHMVSLCKSLRDSTQHLSEFWGNNAQGEPMKKLGLPEAKRIVEEGLNW
jgi:hypothetical protein